MAYLTASYAMTDGGSGKIKKPGSTQPQNNAQTTAAEPVYPATRNAGFLPAPIGWRQTIGETAAGTNKQAQTDLYQAHQNSLYAKKMYGETMEAALSAADDKRQYEQAVQDAAASNGVVHDIYAFRVPEEAKKRWEEKEKHFQTLLDQDFQMLGRQVAANDWMRYWQDPTLPVGGSLVESAVDPELRRRLQAVCKVTGYDFDARLDQAVHDANQAYLQETKAAITQMAKDAPGWSSALSVLMTPVKLGESVIGAIGNLFGLDTDKDSGAYRATNIQEGVRRTVGGQLESQYGKAAAQGYNAAMNIADSLFMTALLGSGMVADGVDAAGGAAEKYTALIEQGVAPEEAALRAGVAGAVDLLVSSGAGEEAIGKTIREMGLTDKVVELGKKLPGGKAVFDAVDERTEMALHQLGMDLDKMNLTRDGENDVIKLVEAANGLTDEELGKLAKIYRLTGETENGIIKKERGGNQKKWRLRFFQSINRSNPFGIKILQDMVIRVP